MQCLLLPRICKIQLRFQRDSSLRRTWLRSLPQTLHLPHLTKTNRSSYGRVSRQEYVLAGGLSCHRTAKSWSIFGTTALSVISGWRPPLSIKSHLTKQHPDWTNCQPAALKLLQSFRRHTVVPCRYCQLTNINKDRHWRQCHVLHICAFLSC